MEGTLSFYSLLSNARREELEWFRDQLSCVGVLSPRAGLILLSGVSSSPSLFKVEPYRSTMAGIMDWISPMMSTPDLVMIDFVAMDVSPTLEYLVN